MNLQQHKQASRLTGSTARRRGRRLAVVALLSSPLVMSTAALAGTGSDANGSTTKAAIAATKGSTAKKPKTVPNCALGYVVANNDGWYSIARKSQVTVAALLA
ncbi:MAG: hypothetical protein WCO88_14305, partial [Actinomycetota bacterium]